ncbi:hypothetical protein [Novosphingobium sp. Gsoil 351]|uniref:hypothetical protein n=1 Tax=Novosphingobium sp. Gsoil 351 TaxID=2675225 RepID=UPI0012B47950|nr:hypothetical protein [Novosphingobium sp. Gsoil 351]QGN54125.1 hypothetical protein GKE62_05760 [Novosphingobium sp. Gsoil 351]
MRLPASIAFVVALLASSGAIAADLLPLKQGIYVPTGRPCKGASNAEIVTYWGGKSSIGASQGECSIKTVTQKGNVFTLGDQCRDIQSGDVIVGGLTVLTIRNPSNFRMSGTNYRYCGTKVQF